MKITWHKKNGYVYLFLGVALLAIFFTIFSGSGTGTKEISFSEVVALAEALLSESEIKENIKGYAFKTKRIIMKPNTYPKSWRTSSPPKE